MALHFIRRAKIRHFPKYTVFWGLMVTKHMYNFVSVCVHTYVYVLCVCMNVSECVCAYITSVCVCVCVCVRACSLRCVSECVCLCGNVTTARLWDPKQYTPPTWWEWPASGLVLASQSRLCWGSPVDEHGSRTAHAAAQTVSQDQECPFHQHESCGCFLDCWSVEREDKYQKTL